jgi:HK97 gp10 family phage protein
MKSAFEITGFEEYYEVLTKASVDVNLISREALAEASEILLADMQARVPVDTGNLREHLRIHVPSGEGDFNYREIGILHHRFFTDKKTAIYARVVEFGSIYVGARSYIRAAIRAKRAQILNLFYQRLKARGLVD